MKDLKEEKISLEEDRQIYYNMAVPGLAFIITSIILMVILVYVNGSLPRSISLPGAVVVALASYRMIRGASYDKLLRYPREYFKYDKKVVEENGQKIVVKTTPKPGARRAINETLECVWCTGFWTTLISLFLYFVSPVTYFIMLIFAISGVASFIQLTINLIATKYEQLDMQNEQMEKW